MHRSLFISATVILGWLGGSAQAADAKPEVVTLTLHPAAAPQPALRYRLLPTPLEQQPGNAAPLYLKAFLSLAEIKTAAADWDKIQQWLSTPLNKLPRKEVQETLRQFGTVLHQVELATLRATCDWDPPLREEGNVLTIVLPEAQSGRSVARLLALRARLSIAEGKFDAALADLRRGYAMAGHMAANPFLVTGLVGLSMATMTHQQVEALVQAPGAPNLYWALTTLPDPAVSMRKGVEWEETLIYMLTPELRNLRTADRTPEQWMKVLARFATQVPCMEPGTPPLTAAMMAGAALVGAKERLVAQGMSRAEVERLAPAQAVLLQTVQSFERHRDAMFKWFYLPYWQAAPGLAQVEADLQREQKAINPLNLDLGLVLAGQLLPALASVRRTEAKASRTLGELRTIEALRGYAATHNGKLPARLADVQDLPVPLNAVTGKPFAYRLEGDTAVLGGDDPANTQPREYRLTVSR